MEMKIEKVVLGHCGVDSGQLYISDPAYLPFPESDYEELCKVTLSEENHGGKHSMGVVTETGWGDGVYDVEATIIETKKEGRRIAKIEVVFISEEDFKELESEGE
jgi:hypothetical protein